MSDNANEKEKKCIVCKKNLSMKKYLFVLDVNYLGRKKLLILEKK